MGVASHPFGKRSEDSTTLVSSSTAASRSADELLVLSGALSMKEGSLSTSVAAVDSASVSLDTLCGVSISNVSSVSVDDNGGNEGSGSVAFDSPSDTNGSTSSPFDVEFVKASEVSVTLSLVVAGFTKLGTPESVSPPPSLHKSACSCSKLDVRSVLISPFACACVSPAPSS